MNELTTTDKPKNKLNDYGDKIINAAHIYNMIQRYKRLVAGSVDKNNIEKYQNQLQMWEQEKEKSNDLTNNSNNNIIEKQDFIFAQTIEAAKKYTKDVLGLSCTGYENMSLDIANVVNVEITNLYNIFGNVHSAGYLEGITIFAENKRYIAAYSKSLKEIYFTKHNVGYTSSLSKMYSYAKEQYSYGFWSTNNAEHTIRHELGHAIENWYTKSCTGYQGKPTGKLKIISDLRKNVMDSCGITKWSMNDSEEHMKSAGSILSYYGLKSDGEFIAESIAEYMSGKPREMAKKVIEILLKEG